MKTEQGSGEWNDEFPLDEYSAVYEWIGRWSEVAEDREQRVIALAATKSLHAVGLFMLETMRFLNKSGSSPVSPDELEDRGIGVTGGKPRCRPRGFSNLLRR